MSAPLTLLQVCSSVTIKLLIIILICFETNRLKECSFNTRMNESKMGLNEWCLPSILMQT